MGSVNTRRQTTCLRKAACCALVLAAWGATLVAQSSECRIVLGTDVACRAEPHRDATVVWGHQLGDQFQNVSRVTVDGEEWYLWPRASCWTYGPLTADADVSDPAAGLLAVAEYALALEDAADFEHLVAVDNLLINPQLNGRFRGGVPPMLALRQLQVPRRTGQIRPLVDTANPAISGVPRRELSFASQHPVFASLSGPWCASCAVRTSARARDGAGGRAAR